MKIMGISQLENAIYRNIMVAGMKSFVRQVTDVSEDASHAAFLDKLVETHFDEKFMTKRGTVDQISEQFSEGAYHFQKLSNLAERMATKKVMAYLEAKMPLTDELSALTEEEQDVVDAVITDAPEDLTDTIANRVACALAADKTRAEEIKTAVDVMQKNGDSTEVIEKALQEASQFPASLLDAIVSYQSRNHIKIAFNEGHKDMDAVIRSNADSIQTDSLLVYTMYECFNAGLKPYTDSEIAAISTAFFRS